jgi:hypothetical protein
MGWARAFHPSYEKTPIMTTTPTVFSLDQLDLGKRCEDAFEFEVTDDATGKGLGIHLTIIGGHAPQVQSFIAKNLNERRVFEQMQEKRGKRAAVRKIEDDIEFGTELAAIRIVGWRGISEPCTFENAVRLCTINPPIKEQILKASEDLANFTKPPAKT